MKGKRAKPIMVQGTMSGAGKSLLVAGLCRVFRQDGFRVAPFKAQNMALNSWITSEGLEMGRAQVVQAEAAGLAPSVLMNPVLLKPTTDMGSQVIVLGEVRGTISAEKYVPYRAGLTEEVLNAYNTLAENSDIVVIEGAGSPAEINLGKDDFVNMGLAEKIRAPVLLAGNIDPGGVFAQLCGTVWLLEESQRDLIKALVINKFRGNIELLKPGFKMLEERTGKPVAGVLPYLDIDIEDEDSLTSRWSGKKRGALLDIAVIRLPKISNFTDFYALEAAEGLQVRYVDGAASLGNPDMIIIPGTKNTIADLMWLRECGLEALILRFAGAGNPVMGICGGYQMLGLEVTDGEGVEIPGGASVPGLGLLPVKTVFLPEKQRRQWRGRVNILGGFDAEGYEIHMGKTFARTAEGGAADTESVLAVERGNVSGTYLHGIFDSAGSREALVSYLCKKKGIAPPSGKAFDLKQYKETEFDRLAAAVRENLDMEMIRRILENGV